MGSGRGRPGGVQHPWDLVTLPNLKVQFTSPFALPPNYTI